MAIYIQQLFLVAADFTLASAVSCVLYGLTCVCLGSLVGVLIVLFFFGAVKGVKRTIARKRRAIRTLVSKRTLGCLLSRKRDQTRLGVRAGQHPPEGDGDREREKESSPNTGPPGAEKKSQEATRALAERQLSPEGVSGVMKKPSVMIGEEKAEIPNKYERKCMFHKEKNGFLSPALFIALLWAPVNMICPSLKKRTCKFLTALHKSQD